MMDSKQLALIYLMEEANKLAGVCTKHVHALHKTKTNAALEEQIGKTFSALREIAEELGINEEKVEKYALEEWERRKKDY
jgi:hypothetical protein